MIYISN